MPTQVGSSRPKPKLAAGRTTIAPIAGAKPTIDSSDRSNLPVMMTSDSASTTRASAADEVRIVMMLACAEEDRADQAADDDQHDQRRKKRQVAEAARPRSDRRRRRRDGSALAGHAALLVTRHRSYSFDRGDESVVAPARLVFGHDRRHGA